MTLLVSILAMFGTGVVAAVSPCVLPLLPAVALVLVDGRSTLGASARVLVFGCSAALTFASLGALAGGLGDALSRSWLPPISGMWLIGLGAAALAIDRGWWRPPQWARPMRRRGWTAPIALGVGCGAFWSPCVGPLVGAAATAAAGTGSVWRGASLLFVFGCGVVAPAVVASLVRLPVPAWARRGGAAMRQAMPLLLVAVGVLLVTGWYRAVVQRAGIGT